MDIDKLLLAIVQKEDADTVISAMNQAGLPLTVIASTGGFLAAGNVTLLLGLRGDEVENALQLLRSRGRPRTVHTPREAHIGAATVFILPIEREIRLFGSGQVADTCHNCAEPGAIKFILAIVSHSQSDHILKTLTDWSYRGTLMSTMGGFLRRRNATVIIGARAERIDSIVEQVRQIFMQDPQADSVATLFVLNASQYERI